MHRVQQPVGHSTRALTALLPAREHRALWVTALALGDTGSKTSTLPGCASPGGHLTSLSLSHSQINTAGTSIPWMPPGTELTWGWAQNRSSLGGWALLLGPNPLHSAGWLMVRRGASLGPRVPEDQPHPCPALIPT